MLEFIQSITLQHYILTSMLILVAACLQGVSGVGFGMVAAPMLAIVSPEFVPGPMLFLSLIIAIMSAIRERHNIDISGIGFAILGRIPTSILAAMLIGILPLAKVSILFAIVILIGVAMSLAHVVIKKSPRVMFAAGCLSGFMGTLTSVGLPPIALVYQNAPASVIRASLGGFLIFGTLISIAALSLAGRFGWHDIALGLWLIAPLSVGFWLSTSLAKIISPQVMRAVVLSLSGAAAILLLVRHL